MRALTRKLIVWWAFLLLCMPAPALADLEAGIAAFNRGEWAMALKELRPLAKQGDPKAAMTIGAMYLRGHGVPKNSAEAARWFRPFAEKGEQHFQTMLGIIYAEGGTGITQDYAAAATWYQKAADQGQAEAQARLGVLYEEGLGVKQDLPSAIKWYRKAAEQGDAKGQRDMGRMYGLGKGVPQDVVRAHMWLNLAATQGHEDAKTARDALAMTMTPAQLAEAQKHAREQEEYKLVAYIEVQGTCIEDRVRLSPGYASPGYGGAYTGDIVHWLNVKDNVHVIRGSVYHNLAHDRISGYDFEYTNNYSPPFAIEFSQLDARRITGNTLRLHGMSDHSSKKNDAKGPGDPVTCTLKVFRRLFYIPELWTDLGIRLTRERELLKKGNRQ